jgi:hypothetical protein
MWLHRAIQFHVAALSVLGALFIGLRHESTLVPALAALVAVTALIVTDNFAWIRLNGSPTRSSSSLWPGRFASLLRFRQKRS